MAKASGASQKGHAISLAGVSIAPGERRLIEIPLPGFYLHTPVVMPVQVINGRRSGPVLFVSGAIHGDEINGVEIIRRLLNTRQIQTLRGTLIAVPVVNVYGFVGQSRYLPDRRDLNRSFPGSDKGSMAARLADTFIREVVQQCTHGIDIHTGAISRENLPQIRAQVENNSVTSEMACAFGAPVILNAELREGSLRQAASEAGVPMILYEAGEALRFDEVAIRAGVKGVTRVMRYLGMLPRSKRRKPAIAPRIARKTRWVRAPQSGVLRMIVALGAKVEASQVIGWVADPFGAQEAEEVRTPVSGIVIGRTNLPLVHEGEALIHVAVFTRAESATESVEAFQEEHAPQGDEEPGEEPVIV